MSSIQFLAYYLPQYHPIPENDLWWGKGFTEWTNVTKAIPLFKGHEQPKLPADLGFYDLRVPDVRKQQAKLASKYGVDGFIYYHYWFGNGKMLLERPAEELLKSDELNYPFCFCWANETWKGVWHGMDNPEILIEQTYNGTTGFTEHFNYLLPFFKNSGYIKVDNKPMFHIYRLDDIENSDLFLETFNELAVKNGFDGMYFVVTLYNDTKAILDNDLIKGCVGMDVFHKMRYNTLNLLEHKKYLGRIVKNIRKYFKHTYLLENRTKPIIMDYKIGVKNLNIKFPHEKYIPCVFPNWDNSPRSGAKSLIFKNSNPEDWQQHLQMAVDELKKNPENPQYVIVKSWNEWAEGNYLEPDIKYGHKWLQAVKNVKENI